MFPLDARLGAHLELAARTYGTPVYVYDAASIRAQLRRLKSFDTVRFAQKACSNIHVLGLLRGEGAKVDCVSLGELERALRAGFLPPSAAGRPADAEIVYTADVITEQALSRVCELGVPVNCGSEDMLRQLAAARPGHPVWLRINPGFGHGHSKKTNTGGESSKHGIWYDNLGAALSLVRDGRLHLVGLHMHIGSGVDMRHLERVCEAMVQLVTSAGVDLEAISGGGGLSIPYRPGEPEVDAEAYYGQWDRARKRIEHTLGHPVGLEIEPGRFLVGPAGYLVCEVRATKNMGNNHFTLVDAGFNDLARPAMYGAHHEIELLTRREHEGPTHATVVAGPLCESGDVFTQTAGGEVVARELPRAQPGDLLVIHDSGAYAASMASNYNSRPLSPEVLLEGEELRLIRRRQTIDELLALETI